KPNPLMSWKGQLIYAASDNVMVYIERFPMMSDRDTHSGVFFSYRIGSKYGKVKVGDDTEPGNDTKIIVSDNQMYVKKGSSRGLRFNYFNHNPEDEDAHIVENKDWPQSKTPSGEFRFVCDYTIKPAKFDVTPEQVYASDATGVPVYGQ
ncbi:hypothetical protein, partial [Pantoea sp. C2G6]|uniref:hypothetical protein n=1 Tax=Pantoea sp. C2G6 TaxID=3243084 RepID=UPI003EDA47D8